MSDESVCHLEGATQEREDGPVNPEHIDRSSPTGRIALAGLAGLVAATVAISLAVTGNDPVGSAPRDPVPIGGGIVPETTTPAPSAPVRLPPLALLLERAVPASLERASGPAQIRALRRRASGGPPLAHLQLAAAEQRAGHQRLAGREYRTILSAEPNNVPARVGLLLTSAASSPAALRRAGVTMGVLARAKPTSQLVAINQGWLAVYRNDRRTAITSWRRAARLGRTTRLGQSALGALGKLAPASQP